MNEVQKIDEAMSNILKLFHMTDDVLGRTSGGITELPYTVKGAFFSNNPYSIWFVFPKGTTDFHVVKGGEQDCRAFIRMNFKVAFCHKLVYSKLDTGDKKRNIEAEIVGLKSPFVGFVAFINDRRKAGDRASYRRNRWKLAVRSPIRNADLTEVRKEWYLKRLPKTWPKELDPFIGESWTTPVLS